MSTLITVRMYLDDLEVTAAPNPYSTRLFAINLVTARDHVDLQIDGAQAIQLRDALLAALPLETPELEVVAPASDLVALTCSACGDELVWDGDTETPWFESTDQTRTAAWRCDARELTGGHAHHVMPGGLSYRDYFAQLTSRSLSKGELIMVAAELATTPPETTPCKHCGLAIKYLGESQIGAQGFPYWIHLEHDGIDEMRSCRSANGIYSAHFDGTEAAPVTVSDDITLNCQHCGLAIEVYSYGGNSGREFAYWVHSDEVDGRKWQSCDLASGRDIGAAALATHPHNTHAYDFAEGVA